jgi:hypothetical protein
MHVLRRRFKGVILATFASSLLAVATYSHAADVSSGDIQEIRNLFLRKAAAESAHDLNVLDDVLARAPEGQPDPVMLVARAYQFWGRDAVLAHYRETFTGTWRLEPDQGAVRVIPLGPDVVQIFAPTRVTVGAAGQEAKTYPFLINQFAIRTAAGWRISAIVPVPAQ